MGTATVVPVLNSCCLQHVLFVCTQRHRVLQNSVYTDTPASSCSPCFLVVSHVLGFHCLGFLAAPRQLRSRFCRFRLDSFSLQLVPCRSPELCRASSRRPASPWLPGPCTRPITHFKEGLIRESCSRAPVCAVHIPEGLQKSRRDFREKLCEQSSRHSGGLRGVSTAPSIN